MPGAEIKHPLRPCGDVPARLLGVGEQPGAFKHQIDAHFAVRELGGVAFSGNADGLAVDDDVAVRDAHISVKRAMDAVALQQQRIGLGIGEIVDGDDFQVGATAGDQRAQHVATDAAKAIDGDFCGHVVSSYWVNRARTRAAILGPVSPKWSYKASIGAEAPKLSTPKRRPSSPV